MKLYYCNTYSHRGIGLPWKLRRHADIFDSQDRDGVALVCWPDGGLPVIVDWTPIEDKQ